MTLANLKIFLENAKKADRTEEVEMLKKRIARRTSLETFKKKYPNYQEEDKPKTKVKKDGS